MYSGSAPLISVKVNFKRNELGGTRIYKYTPPPINALAPLLVITTDITYHLMSPGTHRLSILLPRVLSIGCKICSGI